MQGFVAHAIHKRNLLDLDFKTANLIVMGVSPRTGSNLFFGSVPAAVLARSDCSILFVSS